MVKPGDEGLLLRWLRRLAPGCGLLLLLGAGGALLWWADLWQEPPLDLELALPVDGPASPTVALLAEGAPTPDVIFEPGSRSTIALLGQASQGAEAILEAEATPEPPVDVVAVLDPPDRPPVLPIAATDLDLPEVVENPAPVSGPPPVAQRTGAVVSYAVVPGDTLTAIAVRFGVGVESLRQFNNLAAGGALRAGQVLRVPSADGPVHVVATGETLYRVATSYGVRVQAVASANDLRGDLILPGQRLIIPGGVRPESPIAEANTAAAGSAPLAARMGPTPTATSSPSAQPTPTPRPARRKS
jgi:LysM repeat protein